LSFCRWRPGLGERLSYRGGEKYAQGRIEFRNITAEVDRGDDADPLRFGGDGIQT
jgi:hypothetical protein